MSCSEPARHGTLARASYRLIPQPEGRNPSSVKRQGGRGERVLRYMELAPNVDPSKANLTAALCLVGFAVISPYKCLGCVDC